MEQTRGEEILAALDPEQREVATALTGPVCVVAGAGTGKTRAITHRIAYGVHTGVYTPTEVLAVTFTTRAAGEMRGRLHQLGAGAVQARTFHSAALRQARYFWPKVFSGQLPELTASKIGLLVEATRRCRVSSDQTQLRDLAGEVEWAKVSNVRPDDYARLAQPAGRSVGGLDPETTARVFAAYEEIKRSRDRIDMEDVLLCAAAVLAEDDRVAAQVRRQYRWFVVDEYQDVNPIQSTLLDLWLGGRDDVCVVGDPLQTIYSFAGASPELLTTFGRRHQDVTRVELVRNYRSSPQIVSVANQVFGPPGGGPDRRRPGVVLRSQQEPGPDVRYSGHLDEVAEAEAVAQSITALRDAGTPLAQVAVLFRINAQSEVYEEALAARGIGYVTRGVERFFDRPEVRQAVTLLRGAARAGVDDTGILADDTRRVLSGMGWTPEAPSGTAARDRWESLQALIGAAEEVTAGDPDATMSALVEELERRAQVQHAPVADGVTLATLHAAKGLEWGAVFLVGMHEGTVPIVYADTPAAVEEERRLFYVGVTRARRQLAVSWAAARAPGRRGTRGPSRFLDRLLPDDIRTTAKTPTLPRVRRGRSVATCRICRRPLTAAADRKIGRCADCPSSYDETLFESLRAWRTDRAAEQKLPAYCVFTDATLVAIAESVPDDTSALVAIPGIGRAKLDKYAEDILALCAPYSVSSR
ncbi:MAG: ATP-dependent DNA helicase UvrD2 [Nocardioidaceae bacterium]